MTTTKDDIIADYQSLSGISQLPPEADALIEAIANAIDNADEYQHVYTLDKVRAGVVTGLTSVAGTPTPLADGKWNGDN